MRRRFVETLADLARKDKRIVLLTGDLGFTVVEPFAEEFPERFFNAGVAEQNMVGVATGLAEAGFIPFVYSIVTFAALRPFEFIRNGPIAQQLPVRIIGVGGGFDYGSAGISHWGLEDLGIMRMQPGLTVVAPADPAQAAAALGSTWALPGPVYYRIGKDEDCTVPGLDGRFRLGRLETVRAGQDLLILATGSISARAVEVAAELTHHGIDTGIAIASSLNPPPEEDLVNSLKGSSQVMTVENHYSTGGLGSLVAEIIADHDIRSRLVRCGVKTLPGPASGSAEHMDDLHGLSKRELVNTALKAFEDVRFPL